MDKHRRIILTPEQVEVLSRMEERRTRELQEVDARHRGMMEAACTMLAAGHGYTVGRMDPPRQQEDGTWEMQIEVP